MVLPAKSGFKGAAEDSCPGREGTGVLGEKQPLGMDRRGWWSESRRGRKVESAEEGGAVVGRGCLCLTEDGSALRREDSTREHVSVEFLEPKVVAA